MRVWSADYRLAPSAIAVWIGVLAGQKLGWASLWVVPILAAAALSIWWAHNPAFTAFLVAAVALTVAVTVGATWRGQRENDPISQVINSQVFGSQTESDSVSRDPAASNQTTSAQDTNSSGSNVIRVVGEVASMPSLNENQWGSRYWSFQVSTETVTWRGEEQSSKTTIIVQVNAESWAASQSDQTEANYAKAASGKSGKADGRAETGSSQTASPPTWGQRIRAYGPIEALPGNGQIQAILRAASLQTLPGGSQIRQGAAILKERLAEIASENAGTGWALIPGMAVGYDQSLDREDEEALKIASLTHLTAVSGSHMAITMSLFAAITKPNRLWRAILSAMFLGLILLVVGPEASVLRCFATGMIGAWGLASARGGQPLAALFAVVIAAILSQPELATSIGFQMSVSATLAILIPGTALVNAWKQLDWPRKLAESPVHPRVGVLAVKALSATVNALVISAVCALAVAPLMPQINDWQSTYGVLANVLVAPAVPVITIGGLLAAATCTWGEPIAAASCKICAPFADWVIAVARRIAALPGSKMPWPEGGAGMVAASAIWVSMVGAGLLVRWIIQKRAREADARPEAARRIGHRKALRVGRRETIPASCRSSPPVSRRNTGRNTSRSANRNARPRAT